MLYFLVNNDYQYLEAERLARELQTAGKRTALIAIPHKLTTTLDPQLFESILTFRTPAHLPWRRAWLRYVGAQRRIRAQLPATDKDTLILFTEYELLNQLVAITFKERGGSAYLIEDGGVGTYIPLTLDQHEPYNWKNRLLQASMRAIPGLRSTHFTKFDGILFPMMDDRYLDGIFLYRQLAISRKVPVRIIARPTLPAVQTLRGRVVFLNQPFYSEHIQTESNYAGGLRRVLSALCAGYREVLFKFHPREQPDARAQITSQILNEFPAVRVIEGNQPFEALLKELRPEAVASYNSTPLLNLAGTGVQPVFVYHLLPDLLQAPSFAAMHLLLERWGYKFATNWSEVSSGYHAGEQFDNVGAATPLSKMLEHLSPSKGLMSEKCTSGSPTGQ